MAPFITELYCRGIASGCAADPARYCPTAPVTRAQMAVFLVGALGEQPSGAVPNAYFGDVPDDAFAGFVNRLYELGITGGCGGGNFCPTQALTREQMAVFLVVAMEERGSSVPSSGFPYSRRPPHGPRNRDQPLGRTGRRLPAKSRTSTARECRFWIPR